MRLVKRICKQCREEVAAWTMYDDRRWRKNQVLCPAPRDIFTCSWSVLCIPPKGCKYAAEHLVSQKAKSCPKI